MPTRKVASVVGDGVLCELAWNCEQERTDFIVYRSAERTVERTRSLKIGGTDYVPPSQVDGIVRPDSSMRGCVLLPTEAEVLPEDTVAWTTTLLDDLRGFINRYVRLPDGAVDVVAAYVCLSWVYDAFSELPYLAFRSAAFGRGKSRALATIGSVCYRQMTVSGGSSGAATRRILDAYRGTLVADEFDSSHGTELASALNRILNLGFEKNKPLVLCEGEDHHLRSYEVFGPKVFALRGPLGDDAIESRTISISMRQLPHQGVPRSLPRRRFDAEALELRNRLLSWRVAMYSTFDRPVDESLASSDLDDRGNQIGLPLMTVARQVGGNAMVEAIVSALRDQKATLDEDRADSVAGEVVRAVLEVDARDRTDIVRPGKIAAHVMMGRSLWASFAGNTLTPQKVGRILKNELELPSAGRDHEGVRYRLDPGRAEELRHRYGGAATETTPSSQRHGPDERPGATEDGSSDDSADDVVCDGRAEGTLGEQPDSKATTSEGGAR